MSRCFEESFKSWQLYPPLIKCHLVMKNAYSDGNKKHWIHSKLTVAEQNMQNHMEKIKPPRRNGGSFHSFIPHPKKKFYRPTSFTIVLWSGECMTMNASYRQLSFRWVLSRTVVLAVKSGWWKEETGGTGRKCHKPCGRWCSVWEPTHSCFSTCTHACVATGLCGQGVRLYFDLNLYVYSAGLDLATPNPSVAPPFLGVIPFSKIFSVFCFES